MTKCILFRLILDKIDFMGHRIRNNLPQSCEVSEQVMAVAQKVQAVPTFLHMLFHGAETCLLEILHSRAGVLPTPACPAPKNIHFQLQMVLQKAMPSYNLLFGGSSPINPYLNTAGSFITGNLYNNRCPNGHGVSLTRLFCHQLSWVRTSALSHPYGFRSAKCFWSLCSSVSFHLKHNFQPPPALR